MSVPPVRNEGTELKISINSEVTGLEEMLLVEGEWRTRDELCEDEGGMWLLGSVREMDAEERRVELQREALVRRQAANGHHGADGFELAGAGQLIDAGQVVNGSHFANGQPANSQPLTNGQHPPNTGQHTNGHHLNDGPSLHAPKPDSSDSNDQDSDAVE